MYGAVTTAVTFHPLTWQWQGHSSVIPLTPIDPNFWIMYQSQIISLKQNIACLWFSIDFDIKASHQ